MAPNLEPRRTMISTGHFPSSELASLGQNHPSVYQIDVLCPRSIGLEKTLSDALFQFSYYASKGTLLEVLNGARDLKRVDALHALSTSRLLPDVWAITNGTLHLSIGKTSYEGLGVQGGKVHEVFKGKGVEEQYNISVPLLPSTGEDKAKLVRLQKMLEGQKQEWDFMFCVDGAADDLPSVFSLSNPSVKTYPAHTSVRNASNIQTPHFALSPRPTVNTRPKKKRKLHHSRDNSGSGQTMEIDVETDDANRSKSAQYERPDAVEDWEMHMNELFEWVGMASLGAQRLQANDRVDPYIAVYNPPSPYTIRENSHLRWKGLLHPAFVQRIVDGIISTQSAGEHTAPAPIPRDQPFVALTLHKATHSPAPSAKLASKGKTPGIAKVPRGHGEGEDCTSFIFVPEFGNSLGQSPEAVKDGGVKGNGIWAMVESVGRWDARFG